MLKPRASFLGPLRMPQAFREGGVLARCACAALLTVAALACNKKEKASSPAPVTKAPTAEVPVSDAQLDQQILQTLDTPREETAKGELAEEAEDILAKYPGKSAVELLNVPEVNASLKVGLTKLGQDKQLQGRINSTVELAAQLKGLEGTPGSVGLDLKIDNYNQDQKSRMLQAVLSEEPKALVNFLVGEIGEAAPELSYGGVYRASNGVAIKENTPPPKPPVSAPQDD